VKPCCRRNSGTQFSARGIHYPNRPHLGLEGGWNGQPFRNVEDAEETLQGLLMTGLFNSISAFFRGLFGRKGDNFKDLLIADLGIER
jgi:hypothetical protein